MKSILLLMTNSQQMMKIKVTLHLLLSVDKVILLLPNTILSQEVIQVISIKQQKNSKKVNIGTKITLKTHP